MCDTSRNGSTRYGSVAQSTAREHGGATGGNGGNRDATEGGGDATRGDGGNEGDHGSSRVVSAWTLRSSS